MNSIALVALTSSLLEHVYIGIFFPRYTISSSPHHTMKSSGTSIRSRTSVWNAQALHRLVYEFTKGAQKCLIIWMYNPKLACCTKEGLLCIYSESKTGMERQRYSFWISTKIITAAQQWKSLDVTRSPVLQVLNRGCLGFSREGTNALNDPHQSLW